MPIFFNYYQSIVLILVFLSLGSPVQAQKAQADSLLLIGDYNKAIELYESLPESAMNYFHIARAYTNKGGTSKALEAYDKSISLDAAAPLSRYNRAKLLLASNDVIPASIAFSKLSNQYPYNPSYAYYKGQSLEKLNSIEQAMDVYENVLKLDSGYRKARVALVPLLIKNKEYTLAVRYCEEILTNQPDDIQFNSLIAQAYFYSKVYFKAIEHLEHLFTLGYDTDFNRRILALSYFQSNNWEKALENINIYIEQYDNSSSEMYFVKSQAHSRLYQYDEALDAIEYSILYKRPDIHKEYVQMATIKAAQQDFKGTFESMLLAYEENREDKIVAYQLARAADSYFKDKKSILAYYERFLEKYGKEGAYGEYAQSRANDLKKEIFMKIED